MHITLPKRIFTGSPGKKPGIQVSPLLLETVGLDPAAVFVRLATRVEGLTADQAATRLAEQHGPNVLARDERPSVARLLWRAVGNPLVILLAVLAIVSIATGDARAATVMGLMIAISVGLKLFQETKAGNSAARLRAMISVHAARTAASLRSPGPRTALRQPGGARNLSYGHAGVWAQPDLKTTPPRTPLPVPRHATSWDAMRQLRAGKH